MDGLKKKSHAVVAAPLPTPSDPSPARRHHHLCHCRTSQQPPRRLCCTHPVNACVDPSLCRCIQISQAGAVLRKRRNSWVNEKKKNHGFCEEKKREIQS
jgi:hypothetical protein